MSVDPIALKMMVELTKSLRENEEQFESKQDSEAIFTDRPEADRPRLLDISESRVLKYTRGGGKLAAL